MTPAEREELEFEDWYKKFYPSAYQNGQLKPHMVAKAAWDTQRDLISSLELTLSNSTAPDVLAALIALRSFMWSEGYADQTPAMAQADAAIAKAEEDTGDEVDPRNAFSVRIVMHTDEARKYLNCPDVVRSRVGFGLDANSEIEEEIDYTLEVERVEAK